MTSRPAKRTARVLWVGVLIIAGLLLVRPRLQHALMLRTALSEPSVTTELVEELAAHDAQPLRVIEQFHRTRRIPHRIAALRALSRGSWDRQLQPLPRWLHDAALDADFQVRELALGMAKFMGRTESEPLIRAGLREVDPELKHVALRAAGAVGATNLISDVAALLADPDLNVQIAAATALRPWTGQDFGVRRALLGGEYNDLGGQRQNVDPDALGKVQSGLAEWRTWWLANATNWSRFQPPAPAASIEQLRPAPDFMLRDLSGRPVRLSDFHGRPVLLNFWATWCTACWSELPELVKLHDRHGDQLVILGIALDGLPDQHELDHGHKESDHAEGHGHDHGEPANATTPHAELVRLVGDFARAKGLDYPILLDPEGVSSLVYQGNELPVNVLIDAEGHLRRRFVGPRSPEAFEAMIAEVR